MFRGAVTTSAGVLAGPAELTAIVAPNELHHQILPECGGKAQEAVAQLRARGTRPPVRLATFHSLVTSHASPSFLPDRRGGASPRRLRASRRARPLSPPGGPASPRTPWSESHQRRLEI